MCRASPFHPVGRRGSDFVVRAFFNLAIRGFLRTLGAWRVALGITLGILAAAAVDCCCFVFYTHFAICCKVAKE